MINDVILHVILCSFLRQANALKGTAKKIKEPLVLIQMVVEILMLVFVTGETAVGVSEVMLVLVETITVALRQRL